MNTRENMIILKGQIKTPEIKRCAYNRNTAKMDVEFYHGNKYSYAYLNVEWLKDPRILKPEMYQISKDGHAFGDIKAIYEFSGRNDVYWHICFEDGKERDYLRNDLEIRKSCLNQGNAQNVFEYIKQVANLSELKNEETGEKLLVKRFEKITFIEPNVALAKYLNPSLSCGGKIKREHVPIFPFGCNNSQYRAVKNAMENQVSVIQGPPGTGKTQTILNIIANILMQGKTVQIVSNNNSATDNVYEKMSLPKYGLGFLAAKLGNAENKKAFIEQQTGEYPSFSSWERIEDFKITLDSIKEQSVLLKDVFDKQERLALLRQEQSNLTTETQYFHQYLDKVNTEIAIKNSKKGLSSKDWVRLWQECQHLLEKQNRLGILFKLKSFFRYGISDKNFYKQDFVKIIAAYQAMYYHTRQYELEKEIQELNEYLTHTDKDISNVFCERSMAVLKSRLAEKYEKRKERQIFSEEDLWKRAKDVLDEYPVILSTTFSSRNSLSSDVIYDYLIMDEASQVDIATGVLALSCAKNVVIVGDTKQLPNVIKDDVRTKAEEIYRRFGVDQGYRFTKSFLQSIIEVIPNVTHTLLREHYRCHPKIIGFCNQKFYKGELIIMTEDKGEEDVLAVVKTVPGNHARSHYSQRQIDVIRNEIVPKYVESREETGIIAPYKMQVEALEKEFEDIGAATVHKFQGKEKDMIIISTVDDILSDFVDDPYLINVAVSRAKKKLVLVVTGNMQKKERNIIDLIHYIQYLNFEVAESRVYSVFDYLYKQYAEERIAYLMKHKRISEYDSENLMYALLEEILSMDRYSDMEVLCHFQLNMLIKDTGRLNEREKQYIENPATHIDFLICNRISKKTVMAIEVDGYEYHKPKTVQALRDIMKNQILEMFEIPLLRFQTNGSGEKEKIVEMLDKLR